MDRGFSDEFIAQYAFEGQRIRLQARGAAGGSFGLRLEDGYPFCYVSALFRQALGYGGAQELMDAADGCFINILEETQRLPLLRQAQASLQEQGCFTACIRVVKKDKGICAAHLTLECITHQGALSALGFLRLLDPAAEECHGVPPFSRLLDALPCGACRLLADDVLSLTGANDRFYSMFGYTRPLAAKAGFTSARYIVIPEDFDSLHSALCQDGIGLERHYEQELRCTSRNGALRWMLLQCRLDGRGEADCIFVDVTGRRREQERLRMSEAESRIAIRLCGKLINTYDIFTRTLFQTPESAAQSALPAVMPDMPESVIRQGMVSPESVEDYRRFFRDIQNGVPSGSVYIHMKDGQGLLRWFEERYNLVNDGDGVPRRAIISHEDVTERREKELAFQKWTQHFEAQQQGSIGYYEYNLTKNIFEGVSGRATEELPSAQMMTFSDVAGYAAENFVYEEDREKYLEVFQQERLLLQYYTGNREIRLEHRRKTKEGRIFWALGIIQMIPDPYSDCIKAFLLIKDIDDQKRQALHLQRLSETDPLTGLLNRRTIARLISQILNEEKRRRHALIIMDIDHFKGLNDSFGHQFGDSVIRDVADALKSAVFRRDLCGRLGGDEFIIFLRSVSPLCNLTLTLKRMQNAICLNYPGKTSITGSLGLASYPLDALDFDKLYACADAALYAAKENGRNQAVIYRPDLPGAADKAAPPVLTAQPDEGPGAG